MYYEKSQVCFQEGHLALVPFAICLLLMFTIGFPVSFCYSHFIALPLFFSCSAPSLLFTYVNIVDYVYAFCYYTLYKFMSQRTTADVVTHIFGFLNEGLKPRFYWYGITMFMFNIIIAVETAFDLDISIQLFINSVCTSLPSLHFCIIYTFIF